MLQGNRIVLAAFSCTMQKYDQGILPAELIPQWLQESIFERLLVRSYELSRFEEFLWVGLHFLGYRMIHR
jgi:hypothetical protein